MDSNKKVRPSIAAQQPSSRGGGGLQIGHQRETRKLPAFFVSVTIVLEEDVPTLLKLVCAFRIHDE
jgi:hypothetical protein